jgi:hypothetical protein
MPESMSISKILDTGFRRYDGKVDFLTFHEYARIMFEQSKKLDSALNRALAHLRAASEKI